MPVRFEIKPSRIFILLLSSLHLLAMATVMLTKLVFWAKTGILLLLASSLLHHLYRQTRDKRFWHTVTLDNTQLQVTMLNGVESGGELMSPTVVTPLCVVLCARFDDCKFPVCQVVFRDAMPAGKFRELRVLLRYPG
jgi:hypothetical protein